MVTKYLNYMKRYDFIIVGAGLFGSTFARTATDSGYRCLVLDKRKHIAGNCHTENINGINVHTYGPHIFHTNDKKIWDFVNRFAEFNNYVHTAKVRFEDKLYSFPINLLTIYQLWDIKTPEEAVKKLESVRIHHENPENLEEWVLDKVGSKIYDTFIRGYTAKQWGKNPKELPSSIIQRIPIRLTFNDNYFTDRYQGIPIGGYTSMVSNMLSGIEVILEEDYLQGRDFWDKQGKIVVYTGPIDEFFDYEFGELEWRSLDFEHLYFSKCDYQGGSIVNYTSQDVPYTRIVEYKHFDNPKIEDTIIAREYPRKYERGLEKFYPINTNKNNEMLIKYQSAINKSKYIFGGRLAEYKYYDMHQVVASAISKYKHFFVEWS